MSEATGRMLSANDRLALAAMRGKAQAEPFLMPAYGEQEIAPYRSYLECGLTVILTVDRGHWFPNEDWQNCWHVSVSQRGREPERELERELLEALFPASVRELLCLEHRPESPVHHWRLFFTDAGEFVVPKGEMYTRRGTKDYFERRERAKATQRRPDFAETGDER